MFGKNKQCKKLWKEREQIWIRLKLNFFMQTHQWNLNKYESFQKLSIPERNNLVDEVCLEALRKSCKDDKHINAVSKEILSYKFTKEEEDKYYGSDEYVKGLERPENFDEMLKVKYLNLISNIVSHSTIHKQISK